VPPRLLHSSHACGSRCTVSNPPWLRWRAQVDTPYWRSCKPIRERKVQIHARQGFNDSGHGESPWAHRQALQSDDVLYVHDAPYPSKRLPTATAGVCYASVTTIAAHICPHNSVSPPAHHTCSPSIACALQMGRALSRGQGADARLRARRTLWRWPSPARMPHAASPGRRVCHATLAGLPLPLHATHLINGQPPLATRATGWRRG